MKNPFKKKRESITNELRMLPRETKKRILENVSRRRNEILEEKLLEKQLGRYKRDSVKGKQRTWGEFKKGMQSRRTELKKQGILKPLVRYDKKNFQSPIEQASIKARQEEIRRLENQRNKLKSGYQEKPKVKLKKLKLKAGKKINLGVMK